MDSSKHPSKDPGTTQLTPLRTDPTSKCVVIPLVHKLDTWYPDLSRSAADAAGEEAMRRLDKESNGFLNTQSSRGDTVAEVEQFQILPPVHTPLPSIRSVFARIENRSSDTSKGSTSVL